MTIENKVVIPGLQGLKGYADIPKILVQSPDLGIRAKALAIYLYSIQHNNQSVSPRRETIQQRLGLGKTAYLAAKNELSEKGWLDAMQMIITQPDGTPLFSRNTYLLKLPDLPKTEEKIDEKSSILKFESNRLSYSYGQLPKVIFFDDRLKSKMGLNAIVLYAYLCSFGGSGTDRTAFPKTDDVIKSLGIVRNSFAAALNLLEETGYIKIEKLHNVREGGKFSRNLYTITDHNAYLEERFGNVFEDRLEDLDNPTDIPPPKINPHTMLKNQPAVSGETMLKNPPTGNGATMLKNRTAAPSMLKKPTTGTVKNRATENVKNPSTNIITSDIEETAYNKQLSYPSFYQREEMERWIRERCGFNEFLVIYDPDRKVAQDILNIILNTLEFSSDPIKVGSIVLTKRRALEILGQYEPDTWDYVIESTFDKAATGKDIRNLPAYVFVTVINAPSSMNLYYRVMVETDKNRE